MPRTPLVALDIETTGLDPTRCRLLAVALARSGGEQVLIHADEARLLQQVETAVSELPATTTLVSWNGEGFDLPFLSYRFHACVISTSLSLEPRGFTGKYDAPLFSAVWGGRDHVDIAYYYREFAEDQGINWSLKPVAKALGFAPVEVDRDGPAIAALPREHLAEYVASDARFTRELASRLVPSSIPVIR